MTTFGVPPENPTDYLGPTKALTPQVKAPRAPATTDKNHPIGARWWDTATNDWYWLSHFDSGDAIWKKMTATSSSSPLVTLTTDDATVVNPVSNNIDVAGNSAQGVSTSGAGDTVTITVADATDSTKGVASFDSGDFTVTAGSVSLAGGAATQTFTGDSGTATPVAGETILAGGTGITTSAAGQTVTFDLDSPVLVANGGTGTTTLTDGGILLGSGTGAITATAQPTDGQLLIGSTGVDPVLATLTEGEGIDITNAAGSITIETELATAAATVGAANIGAAAFDSTDFDVTAGFVSIGGFVPNYRGTIQYSTDFFHTSGLRGFIAPNNFGIKTASADEDHPGVCRTYTSGSDTNFGVFLGANTSANSAIYVSGGRIVLKYTSRYSDAPAQGSWAFGLLNPTYTAATDAIYFEVTDFSSSADIQATTMNSSTSTSTSCSVDKNTTWRNYTIDINADATEVLFYIDDVLKATHTTNIPASTTNLSYAALCSNNAGTSSLRQLEHDYIEFNKYLDGDRA